MKMKKIVDYVRRNKFLLSFILVIPIMFSACKKSDTGPGASAAGLMAFNLIPDKASIGIDISGNSLTNSPLLYTNYTGTYLPVYVGQREVTAFDINSDSAIAKATENFEPNKYYSVFALGNNGNYKTLLVNDNLDTLTSATGQAYVRYINAIPDSSTSLVTISSNGTDVVSVNATYATISDFEGVTPGDFTVGVNNETNINASRTITFEKDKAYTVLLVGVPGATDSAKAVQIKYITNGTLTP